MLGFEELWIEHWFVRKEDTHIDLYTESPLHGDDVNRVKFTPFEVWETGNATTLPPI